MPRLVLPAYFLQVPFADLIEEEWRLDVRVGVGVPPQVASAAGNPHVGIGKAGVALFVQDLEGIRRRIVHLCLLPVGGMTGLAVLRPPGLVGHGDHDGVGPVDGFGQGRATLTAL